MRTEWKCLLFPFFFSLSSVCFNAVSLRVFLLALCVPQLWYSFHSCSLSLSMCKCILRDSLHISHSNVFIMSGKFVFFLRLTLSCLYTYFFYTFFPLLLFHFRSSFTIFILFPVCSPHRRRRYRHRRRANAFLVQFLFLFTFAFVFRVPLYWRCCCCVGFYSAFLLFKFFLFHEMYRGAHIHRQTTHTHTCTLSKRAFFSFYVRIFILDICAHAT